MMKRLQILAILCLPMLLLCASLQAQNNTHSPFSRFGYGELNDNIPGAYRALGGIGIGMRDPRVINPSQPASYTVVDSTTFMFDLAASGLWNGYQDASGARNRGNGNLEDLTMQFPIWKHYIGMSLGLNPYSMVGYDFTLSDSINSDYHYARTYYGDGGITQIYGGLSFNILNWFAAGANIYYMFGDVTNNRGITFTEIASTVTEVSKIHVSDVRFRTGAQFFHTFERHSFSVGAIFEAKSALNGSFSKVGDGDTLSFNDSIPSDLPMVWGVGAMYSYGGRFMISADYTRYCWAQARYFDQALQLQDRQKIAVGFEYTHNPLGRRYIDHMPWRVGFAMSDPYIRQIPGREYLVSVGTAFPLPNVGTTINASIEYGHRGTADLLKENYLRFTLNVSVRENWFFKRRL